MIQIQEVTKWDIDNRPRNYSSILNDNEWYAVMNELGEVNDRTEEAWDVSELLSMVQKVSICGTWQYATTHDFQRIFNLLEARYKAV
jgi:hypothetical protein